MNRKLMMIIGAVTCILLTSSFAQSEIVTLKSGKVYDGQIIYHEDREFKIITERGGHIIPYKMVDHIKPNPTEDNPGYKHIDSINKKVASIQKRTKARQKTRVYNSNKRVNVEFYMTTWCPYCKKMEKYLKKMNAKYKKYNIEKSKSAYKRYRAMGGNGVPVVKIGDRVIHGYNTTAVKRALQKRY